MKGLRCWRGGRLRRCFFLDKGVWRGFWVEIGGLDWYVVMERG